jgi:alkylation response protein AidB-like acyl-CoA dehydrogenase
MHSPSSAKRWARSAHVRGYFDKLLAHVKADASLRSDPLVLDRIGGLGAEIEASRLLAVRTAQVVEQGEVPLWQAAMLKVYASELDGAPVRDGVRPARPRRHASPRAAARCATACFEYGVRDALLYTIGGGTNEIQRTDRAARAGPASLIRLFHSN